MKWNFGKTVRTAKAHSIKRLLTRKERRLSKRMMSESYHTEDEAIDDKMQKKSYKRKVANLCLVRLSGAVFLQTI
ncbi:MAG: hypothetical protein WCO55_02370 [Candidatus Falkowbacteria bacterium]